MRFFQWTAVIFTNIIFAGTLSATNLGSSSVPMEQIQVPHCLLNQLLPKYQVLAENTEFKILNVPSKDLNQIALLADEAGCGRFVNVSQHLIQGEDAKSLQKLQANYLLSKPLKKGATFRNADDLYTIEHEVLVNEALPKITRKNIMATLRHLTEYNNRSATKRYGVDAAKWLKESFDNMALNASRGDTDSWFVATGSPYIQDSVVTVVGKNINAPAIVIGAHMDTLDGFMPGADDDGSGSATLMEVARVFLDMKIEQKNPIYFIWYAAEERGLVGSQRVVDDFLNKHIPVKAVMQLDMTGFRNVKSDPTMWVFTDYTDAGLNYFIKQLIETYVDVPVGESQCGYGCSDHASWTAQGIPAAFPCETSFEDHNKAIHSPYDTIDLLTPKHMVNFAKLGLAFAIELVG